MPGPASILRELHRLRRHVRDLQTEIDRGPRLLKAQQTRVARQEEGRSQGHDAIKHLKVELHEKEVTLKATYQQIAKHEKQLNEAAGKKEYDALKTEIATDRQTCQRLEDEILETMSQIEEMTAQVPELERSVQRAQEEMAQFEQAYQVKRQSLLEQMAVAQKQLADTEATLPHDVRSQYERLVSAQGEDGLSAVEHRACLACCTGITEQNFNDLRNEMLVVCKSCGRILYLPE